MLVCAKVVQHGPDTDDGNQKQCVPQGIDVIGWFEPIAEDTNAQWAQPQPNDVGDEEIDCSRNPN